MMKEDLQQRKRGNLELVSEEESLAKAEEVEAVEWSEEANTSLEDHLFAMSISQIPILPLRERIKRKRKRSLNKMGSFWEILSL